MRIHQAARLGLQRTAVWTRGSVGDLGLSLDVLRLCVPLDEPPILDEGVAEGGDGFAPLRIDRSPAEDMLDDCSRAR